jgi:hypothetical protein
MKFKVRQVLAYTIEVEASNEEIAIDIANEVNLDTWKFLGTEYDVIEVKQ